jgi:hypothetical protein
MADAFPADPSRVPEQFFYLMLLGRRQSISLPGGNGERYDSLPGSAAFHRLTV